MCPNDKCRFDVRSVGGIHYHQCSVHEGGAEPALCTHAAAALQARALDFEEMYARTKLERDEAEARVLELEAKLAERT